MSDHDEVFTLGGSITFGPPPEPTPEDYKITVDVTSLSYGAKIAVGVATIAAWDGAPRYWLKALVGPDGHYVLDSRLTDSITLGVNDFTANKKHGFSEADVINAIYADASLYFA